MNDDLWAKFISTTPLAVVDYQANNERGIWDRLNVFATANTSVSELKSMHAATSAICLIEQEDQETIQDFKKTGSY